MLQALAAVVALMGLVQSEEDGPCDREVLRAALHWNGEADRGIDNVVIVKNRLEQRVVVEFAAAGARVELVRSHWECVVYYSETLQNQDGPANNYWIAVTYLDKYDLRK